MMEGRYIEFVKVLRILQGDNISSSEGLICEEFLPIAGLDVQLFNCLKDWENNII